VAPAAAPDSTATLEASSGLNASAGSSWLPLRAAHSTLQQHLDAGFLHRCDAAARAFGCTLKLLLPARGGGDSGGSGSGGSGEVARGTLSPASPAAARPPPLSALRYQPSQMSVAAALPRTQRRAWTAWTWQMPPRDAAGNLDVPTLAAMLDVTHRPLCDAEVIAARIALSLLRTAASPPHGRADTLLVGLVPPLVSSIVSRYRLYRPHIAVPGLQEGDSQLEGWLQSSDDVLRHLADGGAPAAFSSSQSDGRHIAVLGGSFNPVTLSHLAIAADVLTALSVESLRSGAVDGTCTTSSPRRPQPVDEVWLVACGARPDKPTLTVQAADRHFATLAAVEDTFPGDHRVRVMPLEVLQRKALTS